MWAMPTEKQRACRRDGRARLVAIGIAAVVVILAAPAFASGSDHTDPIAPLALALAIILVAAKIGGELAVRIGQPAVLGELMTGLLLGNLGLVGIHGLEWLRTSEFLDLLARLGVLLLLFQVGLESTVKQMLSVGGTAMLVATVGVVVPMGLGWLCSALLLPDHPTVVHAFVGATLCATSVGITARVLKDLGSSQTPEARIILGAAVIDDVLGLVVLAGVSGVIAATAAGTRFSVLGLGWIVAKAAVFLVGALALGLWLTPRVLRQAARLKSEGVLLASGLVFCFLLAWAANAIGLAPIVGAFAAGLILEEVHFKDFTGRGEHGLEELTHPITSFLVPVFFVFIGMKTDLRSFAVPGVPLLAAVLTIAAIMGKQLCSFAVPARTADRISVGIGMVPRGEVGLIFADVGASLSIAGRPVIDPPTFAAIVVMVILTTFLTPPALKWSFGRLARRGSAQPLPGASPEDPEQRLHSTGAR